MPQNATTYGQNTGESYNTNTNTCTTTTYLVTPETMMLAG
jgi:hypothetical protein